MSMRLCTLVFLSLFFNLVACLCGEPEDYESENCYVKIMIIVKLELVPLQLG